MAVLGLHFGENSSGPKASTLRFPSVKWSRLSQREPGYREVPHPQRKAAAQPAVCRKCFRVGRETEGGGGNVKAEPSAAEFVPELGKRRGETGVKGLLSGRARPATSPEGSARAAGEALRWRLRNVGGGEERTRSGKGREVRSHRTHARPAPPARWPGRLAAAARPAPTARTLEEEEPPRPPATRGPPRPAGGP